MLWWWVAGGMSPRMALQILIWGDSLELEIESFVREMISDTLPVQAWPPLWETHLKDGCSAVIAPVVPELMSDGFSSALGDV